MKVRSVPLGPLPATLSRRADGTMIVRTTAPLGDYPKRATERLVVLGRTDAAGDDARVARPRRRLGDAHVWRRPGCGQAHRPGAARSQAVRGAARWRFCPATTASTLLLSLAAQHVGITVAPVSPAYSTRVARLRDAQARDAPADARVSCSRRRRGVRSGASTARCVNDRADVEVIRSLDALARHCADRCRRSRARRRSARTTIAKILLTSGSTAVPKGVINTHRDARQQPGR